MSHLCDICERHEAIYTDGRDFYCYDCAAMSASSGSPITSSYFIAIDDYVNRTNAPALDISPTFDVY